ncbi:TatD family hydrolase [Microbacterium sp.]|uniref:TatD family hydrolase n=1 Tax=Microbacterium sp. TaxID=51671 RepID=UPI0035697C17
MTPKPLPALDAHAHIAPDVTRPQVAALGDALVFAMTRSLAEAARVKNLTSNTLLWGIGIHPGVATARDGWNPQQFRDLLSSFALVGEIGLDRRGGDWKRQRTIFDEILNIIRDEPVLVSVHSSGAASEVVSHLRDSDVRGAILHWFTGDEADVERALDAGSYFSVNAAMTLEQVGRLPQDRVLSETDFPARKVRARKPADIAPVERLLSQAWRVPPQEVRAKTWWNLRTLSEQTGAIERMPEAIADRLLYL